MKKAFFLLGLCVAFMACEKLDELLTFTFRDDFTFKVPANSVINLPFDIITPDMQSNSTTEIEDNNTRTDLVKNIRLSGVQLDIVAPAGRTFDFMKDIRIYITSDNLPDLEIASRVDIPDGLTLLTLETTDEALDNYVKDGRYGIRSAVTTDQTNNQELEIKAQLEFKVTADPL